MTSAPHQPGRDTDTVPAGPQRYRHRPTDIDVMPVDAATLDRVYAWVHAQGAGAYLDGQVLRIIDGNPLEGHATLSVPFGWLLGREFDGRWVRLSGEYLRTFCAPVPSPQPTDPGGGPGRHEWR